MSIFCISIFLLGLSSTISVQLDGNCLDDRDCEGGIRMRCSDRICRCITPWFKPCNSSCEINFNFVYQGEECRLNENCIENSRCQDNRCECQQGFTNKNGVCFKNLGSICTTNKECWSNFCLNSRCTCAPGYELTDDSTNCRRKLVNIYNTANEASVAGAFCVDSSSCIDILAECIPISTNSPISFCKCPIGYKNVENKRCEAIKSDLLSPLDYVPSSYGECGSCVDENAACIEVNQKRTCWCRTGYTKVNNQCVKQSQPKPLLLFPNSNDMKFHDFTNNCNNQIEDNLCVCNASYRFIRKDSPCVKISREWMNDTYEYGLCTQITSRDEAINENGSCPEPLTCVAKRDKYICSCGTNKFRDLDDPSQCVYYLDRTVSSSDDKCPSKNAERNAASVCQCQFGYKATADKRRCEIKLSEKLNDTTCDSSITNHTSCQGLFGTKSLLCTPGDCRCSGNGYYANPQLTYCYAEINKTLTPPVGTCPPNSALKTNYCQCNAGYRPSNNLRQCVNLSPRLTNYTGPSGSLNTTLTTTDCRSLYTGPVEVYTNDICQCQNNAFINDNKKGCWYKLGVTLLSPPDAEYCPPDSIVINVSPYQCRCDEGFTNMNDTRCVRLIKKVYMENDTRAENIPGITTIACVKFFGTGAIKSNQGNYCICRPNAYAVKNNEYCHFLINSTSSDLKGPRNCPDNTNIEPTAPPTACVCKPGYHPSPNNSICVFENINLIGAIEIDPSYTTNCNRYTDDDCKAKYGPQSFCKDEQCYCNRNFSYVNQNKCESFSNYIYPGKHELNLYSCNTNDDCGGDSTLVCNYLNEDSDYKVCQCKNGLFLDVKSQKCIENRCINCDESKNFECRDYRCQCKNGYYLRNSICVEYTQKPQLYQQCDRSIFREALSNSTLLCNSSCNRAECIRGYRAEQTTCVRYQLKSDKCLHQETICSDIDQNAICSREENQCVCKPAYYPVNNICAQAIGTSCVGDEQCGGGMICKGKQCTCNNEQHIEESTDSYGRPIQRCVNNGIDQIRYQPISFIYLVFIQLLFI